MIKLLLAFQVLAACEKFNCPSFQGVTAERARQVIFEITAIDVQQGATLCGPNVEGYLRDLGYELQGDQ